MDRCKIFSILMFGFRLYLLIKLVGGIEVREFSSGLHAIKRNKILRKFSAGQIDM